MYDFETEKVSIDDLNTGDVLVYNPGCSIYEDSRDYRYIVKRLIEVPGGSVGSVETEFHSQRGLVSGFFYLGPYDFDGDVPILVKKKQWKSLQYDPSQQPVEEDDL